MTSRKLSWVLIGALFGGALTFYIWKVRLWMQNWGTQADETTKPLPGDETVRNPMVQSTRAITINAPPEAVWHWLVQIGLDRGGFYSYDALDNEGKPSATTIVPELQALQVGDKIMLDRKTAVTVTHLEPPRAMVWTMLDMPVELGLTADVTMAFVLEPLGGDRSRLIARIRGRLHGSLGWLYIYLLDELVSFLMQRKQLLGIKARAEGSGLCQNQPPRL